MKQNRNRRLARVYAFQTLYALEFHKGEESTPIPTDDFGALDIAYANAIIDGTKANLEAIDALLQSHSPKRKIAHLGAVERNVLRLATWEMVYAPEPVEAGIVINEAIQLVKEYGADKSYKFVNAVLDVISKEHKSGANA
ncbi:MAG: transcription antitermination factor NusB [Negativicoccus succinicivorans]|uniref:transcription antitermination factor NusB n=1 Tax=Veillonellaceae TaxID=31977 RepID=UPI0025D73BAD|nr:MULTISPECIES: transcription antitermination factor NusB [Veillonellaceae]MBS4912756.1 transcription antitermination factor NusB [Veillonella sp.]MBS6028932.1 transcription antitermination factor NusB [Negativicoccus succinicivorans]